MRGRDEHVRRARELRAAGGPSLVRRPDAALWDLRSAWASGRRVSVRVDGADVERVEGVVTQVAASGAFARIAGVHVPADRILAVFYPSRLGDSTAGPDEWSGPPRRVHVNPNQLALSL